MSTYALSKEADRDIETIARATAERWGWPQAEKYLEGLQETFGLLIQFPQLGRPIDHIRAGYHRLDHGRHAIFYRHQPDGILIVRILHQRMNAGDHL